MIERVRHTLRSRAGMGLLLLAIVPMLTGVSCRGAPAPAPNGTAVAAGQGAGPAADRTHPCSFDVGNEVSPPLDRGVASPQAFVSRWIEQRLDGTEPSADPAPERFVEVLAREQVAPFGETMIIRIQDPDGSRIMRQADVYLVLAGAQGWAYKLLATENTTRSVDEAVRPREIRRIPAGGEPGRLWVELDRSSETYEETHDADGVATGERRTTATARLGFLLRPDAAGAPVALAMGVPLREERVVEVQEGEQTRREAGVTELGVTFEEPGVMRVAARTDTLSERQRCWPGDFAFRE